MKILIATFSDNADHQDVAFGLYEQLINQPNVDAYLLSISNPKVPLKESDHTWLFDAPRRPGICSKTFNIFLLMKILYKVRKEKFDVIYFQSLHVWNIPILLAVKGISQTYHIIHEVIPHEGDSQVKSVDFMNKVLVKLADNIVLGNKTYIDELYSRYSVDPKHVFVLEQWRRYPDYTDPVYSGKFLFFGRINPYKGADNLLKIAQLCPEINFDVVGRVDSQMVEIVDQLSKLPNTNMHTGYVTDEEMKNAFIGADWIIVPYNSASQSGIIIDSYRFSRPVIAFNVGAISEQVKDNYSGYLIKGGEIDNFVQKIKFVSKMPINDYKNFCENAYSFGCEKYAATGAVLKFLKMIDNN